MNYNGEQALSEYKREFIVKYMATVSTPPPRPLFGFPAYSYSPFYSRGAAAAMMRTLSLGPHGRRL